jgi:hypothetical protein
MVAGASRMRSRRKFIDSDKLKKNVSDCLHDNFGQG